MARLCSVCSEPQFSTRSGWVCQNGHGGAPARAPDMPTWTEYEPDYDAYIAELESLEESMARVATYDDWFPDQYPDCASCGAVWTVDDRNY